jgi:hypothetical protein
MRSIVITSCAFALLFSAGSAKANDMINTGAGRAQRCLHTVLLTNLFGGLHERAKVIKVAVAVCEPDLMELVLHFEPAADKDKLHYSMMIEAAHQLDLIIANGEWNGE